MPTVVQISTYKNTSRYRTSFSWRLSNTNVTEPCSDQKLNRELTATSSYRELVKFRFGIFSCQRVLPRCQNVYSFFKSVPHYRTVNGCTKYSMSASGCNVRDCSCSFTKQELDAVIPRTLTKGNCPVCQHPYSQHASTGTYTNNIRSLMIVLFNQNGWLNF